MNSQKLSTELSQPRFKQNQKIQEIIAALQSNQQLVVEGDQSQTNLKDHLHFDDPDDRLSFPERQGSLGITRWLLYQPGQCKPGPTRLWQWKLA